MEEEKARALLMELRIERDVTDGRTCVEIVHQLHLVPDPELIIETNQENTVECE